MYVICIYIYIYILYIYIYIYIYIDLVKSGANKLVENNVNGFKNVG